jgi:dipeptidyl aminopeptidase/acylaminoacyl peptidase
VDAFSAATHPTRVMLHRADGTLVRTVDSNPVADLERCQLAPVEFLEIPLTGDRRMQCTMIRPIDFDPTRRYPVWVMTYGGPHAPTVNGGWNRGRGFEQLLAASGVIAFRCDPHSASGRGAKSTWTCYERLGIEETRDMDAAVDWLASQVYVDSSRIGLSGYSYGGYLTAFVMTHSQKFSAGIAGAPVTDWRNYDAFYTERYMNTPQENPDGYVASSVVEAAKNLHGQLLLIHGSADDNVHVQNTFQLAHALQQNDIPFEMMVYPTSRHGIYGMHFQRLNFDFIMKTMRPEGPQSTTLPPSTPKASPEETPVPEVAGHH